LGQRHKVSFTVHEFNCHLSPLGDFHPSDHLLSTSQQNLTKSSTATNDVGLSCYQRYYVKLVQTTTQRKGVTRMYSREHKNYTYWQRFTENRQSI